MAERETIIIDCDPGVDDAIAIALATASPEIEVLALTTVGGNAGIDRVTANAQRILTLLGRTNVPIHRGAWRPIGPPVAEIWPSVHGDDGLGSTGLPEAGPLPSGRAPSRPSSRRCRRRPAPSRSRRSAR